MVNHPFLIIVKSENKFTLVARRGWVTLEETPQQKPPTVPLCVQTITGSIIKEKGQALVPALQVEIVKGLSSHGTFGGGRY